MKAWGFMLVAGLSLTGCTTWSLNRHTVMLSRSAMELRYRIVLDNLAMVADDRFALPTYASIYTGAASISDTGQLVSTPLWQNTTGMVIQDGFGSETLSPQVTRQVVENWTLDPMVTPEKLEAVRAACRWVVYGPSQLSDQDISLVSSPLQVPTTGRHFGIRDRLAQLPEGWLHIGRQKDVPARACFKSHCNGVWVWVMPASMQGLADFTLIAQDIARVQVNSPSLFYPQPIPSPLKYETLPILGPQGRVLYKVAALVSVASDMRLVPDLAYQKNRYDDVGSDTYLRSVISANSSAGR